jgi:hypothetical protein
MIKKSPLIIRRLSQQSRFLRQHYLDQVLRLARHYVPLSLVGDQAPGLVFRLKKCSVFSQ